MEKNIIQQRIDRIIHLLNRLDSIPDELDIINKKLTNNNLSSNDFTQFITHRQNLLQEQQNKAYELKNVYRIIDMDEESFRRIYKHEDNQTILRRRRERIEQLLNRLDKIPDKVEDIDHKIFNRCLTRKRFERLVASRNYLLSEQENKQRELKELYQIMKADDF